jgi:hypothetical protein
MLRLPQWRLRCIAYQELGSPTAVAGCAHGTNSPRLIAPGRWAPQCGSSLWARQGKIHRLRV